MKKIGILNLIMTVLLLYGVMQECDAQTTNKRSKQAAKKVVLNKRKKQNQQRRAQAQVVKAKYKIDRAQEDIDRALALSLQEQEQQRVLQESSQEIKEAAAKLQQALVITRPEKSLLRSKGNVQLINKVKPVRVDVVQQQGTECGYWAALDAVIMFNTLQLGVSEARQDAIRLLRDEKRMRTYLEEMHNVLAGLSDRYDMCLFALDEGAIADIMHYYARMKPDDYSMFSMPLPYTVKELPRFQQGIVTIIKRLKKTPQAAHIFFLRSGSSSTQTIGHWIAVVVHNTGQELVCYIIDSLKSLGHDDTWQRLLHVITDVK